jgi:CRISPR type I-E-associated protein CasB/Cse2
MSQPQASETRDGTPESALVSHLTALCRREERGALAELRREAGNWPRCTERALRHVVPFFPRDDSPWRTRQHEDAMLLVATLFALNPSPHDGHEDMGAVMRRTGQVRKSPESTEARFLRLLGARDEEEIATHLRHAVQLAAGAGAPVGWSRLQRDLVQLFSGDEDRRQRVVRQWSRSFWQKETAAATD